MSLADIPMGAHEILCTYLYKRETNCKLDCKDNFALFLQVLQSHIKSKKLHVLFLDDKPVNGQHSG